VLFLCLVLSLFVISTCHLPLTQLPPSPIKIVEMCVVQECLCMCSIRWELILTSAFTTESSKSRSTNTKTREHAYPSIHTGWRTYCWKVFKFERCHEYTIILMLIQHLYLGYNLHHANQNHKNSNCCSFQHSYHVHKAHHTQLKRKARSMHRFLVLLNSHHFFHTLFTSWSTPARGTSTVARQNTMATV